MKLPAILSLAQLGGVTIEHDDACRTRKRRRAQCNCTMNEARVLLASAKHYATRCDELQRAIADYRDAARRLDGVA